MNQLVTSRFTIASKRLDANYLFHHFSWPVLQSVGPDETIDQYLTFYDLRAGQHTRVDEHLEAVKAALLKKEPELSRLMDDCQYTLWVSYRSSNGTGDFKLSSYLLSFFSLLRMEVIFQLNEDEKVDE